MMPPLISFQLAKDQVHVTSSDLDRDIETKVRLASSIVATHCKLTSIPSSWIVDASEIDHDSLDLILYDDAVLSPPSSYYIRPPGDVQAAVLLIFGDLFYGRESSTSNLLSDAVINLLTPFRDPTMA